MLVYNKHNFGYWDITMDELIELTKTESFIRLCEVDYKQLDTIRKAIAELGYKRVIISTVALYTTAKMITIQVWR